MQNQTTTNATATTIQTTNPTNATTMQWMSDDDMYDLIDFGISSNGGRLNGNLLLRKH